MENGLGRQSRVGWDMGVFVDANANANANAAYFAPLSMGWKGRIGCSGRHENYLNECIRIMNDYNILRAFRFCSSSIYFPIFLEIGHSKPGTAFATAIFACEDLERTCRAVARRVRKVKDVSETSSHSYFPSFGSLQFHQCAGEEPKT